MLLIYYDTISFINEISAVVKTCVFYVFLFTIKIDTILGNSWYASRPFNSFLY